MSPFQIKTINHRKDFSLTVAPVNAWIVVCLSVRKDMQVLLSYLSRHPM